MARPNHQLTEERIYLGLPTALLDRIDAWRRVHAPLVPRVDALRRLLELGLAAPGAPPPSRDAA